MICHLLIGIPGSGKSTFAQQWVAADSSYAIVSTDAIRERLFGDASIQGDWNAVEAGVFAEIRTHLAAGTPVIYDATNAKRPWRLGFLGRCQQLLATHPDIDRTIEWMAWHLDTPIATCQERNRQRSRVVPAAVIDDMAAALERFPPCPAEGFADVNTVPVDAGGNYDLAKVFRKIKDLPRSRTSRANRSRHVEWHSYSLLLDFDRLMFLIALILRYPGLGNRQGGTGFETSVEEVGAAMVREYGAVYADLEAIARDLAWLAANGFLRPQVHLQNSMKTPLQTSPQPGERLLNPPSSQAGGSEAVGERLNYPPSSQEEDSEAVGERLNYNYPPSSQEEDSEAVGERLNYNYPPSLAGKGGRGVRSALPEISITLKSCQRPPNTEVHRYSDRPLFLRLMGIIRAILRCPLQEIPGENSLDTLVEQLAADGIVGETRDNLRRDIEKALKPYGIFNAASYRRGYFIGTAIFTPGELNDAYKLLQSQAGHFDDPVALEAYRIFGERLQQSRLLVADEGYPVRVLGSRPIVKTADLPSSALIRHVETVERAILFQRRYANEGGELLELHRLRGGGRFAGDGDEFFRVWPVQLVFHNIAWYLGFECCGGEQDGLLRFERLDRLFLGQPTHQTRSAKQQRDALKRLERLYDASAGAFLGDSAAEQALYLSPRGRQQVEVRVELWCSDASFRFISEGTQRFGQMRMSPQPEGSSRHRSMFSLEGTGDTRFPHRFQVRLPRWSLRDVDLRRWIVGWGGDVKVVEPPELVAWVRGTGEAIVGVYGGFLADG